MELFKFLVKCFFWSYLFIFTLIVCGRLLVRFLEWAFGDSKTNKEIEHVKAMRKTSKILTIEDNGLTDFKRD